MRWQACDAPFQIGMGVSMLGLVTDRVLYGGALAAGLLLASLLFFAPHLRVPRFLRGRLRARKERFPGQVPVTASVFLLGFGGSGTLLNANLSNWLTLPISLVAGVLLVVAAVALFTRIFGGEAEAMTGQTLVGSLAQVSLTIPENGVGAIAYIAEGKRHTLPARSSQGISLETHTRVLILDLRSGTALVDPL